MVGQFSTPIDTLTDLTGSGYMLVIGAALAFRCRSGRIILAAASFLLFLLPLCAFTNLYFIHNYYAYANGVFLIVAIGIVISDLSSSKNLLNKTLASIYFILVAYFSLFHYFEAYWPAQGNTYKFNEVKTDIDRYTATDDVLIILTSDWSSEMPYYLERRAFMYPDWTKSASTSEKVLKNLSAYNVGAVLLCGDERVQQGANEILNGYSWISPAYLIHYQDCDAYYHLPRGQNSPTGPK